MILDKMQPTLGREPTPADMWLRLGRGLEKWRARCESRELIWDEENLGKRMEQLWRRRQLVRWKYPLESKIGAISVWWR